MNEKEILIKAADTIDESVTTLRVDVKHRKPRFKLFGKGWFVKDVIVTEVLQIRPATLRTMVRISRELLEGELKPQPTDGSYLEWVFSTISDNAKKQAKIVAIAIHNSRSEVPTQLVDLIMDSFTSADLWKVIQVVIDKLNVSDFIFSITSTKSIQMLKTGMVSLQPEEIIATDKTISGEQSEILSSIFASAQIIS